MKEITLVPTNGKKYASDEDMLNDWEAGAEFRMYPGTCNITIKDINVLRDRFDRITMTLDFWMYKVI